MLYRNRGHGTLSSLAPYVQCLVQGFGAQHLWGASWGVLQDLRDVTNKVFWIWERPVTCHSSINKPTKVGSYSDYYTLLVCSELCITWEIQTEWRQSLVSSVEFFFAGLVFPAAVTSGNRIAKTITKCTLLVSGLAEELAQTLSLLSPWIMVFLTQHHSWGSQGCSSDSPLTQAFSESVFPCPLWSVSTALGCISPNYPVAGNVFHRETG